jgi:DNA mismatch repair protein MutS2
MQQGALRALEFDRIVEAVERLAQTPPGAARLAQLQPDADSRAVAAALADTAETARFLSGSGEILLRAPAELDAILTALAVEGRALEPMALLGLGTFLDSIDAAVAGIRRQRAAFPLLGAAVESSASFERETADVRRKIDPGGEVVDDASPELKSLRDRLRKQRARLRGTLESYLRGKDTSKYLQQQVVTDRNGRYVLVVRSEHRASIPGIVHGSSASGASLFLEPLSTVEINNDIVALEQQEQEEVRRILLMLSDGFRRRGGELHRTVDVATRLDMLQAKARYSLGVGGVQPAISQDGRLELRAARHPLLIVKGADVVPVDVLLIPPARVLVITGPNTGGKTVTLKTAGLLPIMAQAGLLIPAADGSQVPVFRSVFADIGDEQSIAESLSTFSAHIANIVATDTALTPPSLVLLDEAGGGTDPNEGRRARDRHHRSLPAARRDGRRDDALRRAEDVCVHDRGCNFRRVRVQSGHVRADLSPALRVARQQSSRSKSRRGSGLPPGIIEKARAQRTAREAQLAEHLAKVERETQALDHERRLVARERQMVEETQAKLQGRERDLRDREETFRKRLDQKLDERMRDARREIDAVVDALKARTSSMAGRLVPTGEIGAVRADARSAVEQIASKVRETSDGPPSLPVGSVGGTQAALWKGTRVAVGPLGLEGSCSRSTTGTRTSTSAASGCGPRWTRLRVLVPAARASRRRKVRVHVELAPRDAATSKST